MRGTGNAFLYNAGAVVLSAFIPAAAAADDRVDRVVVTGTKSSQAESAQDVPIAVTAVSGSTIDRESIRDLTELGYRAPNLRLKPTGLNPGHASFSMRGIGANSSTPSDEPVVLTVLDGMVMGTQLGSAVPTFDVDDLGFNVPELNILDATIALNLGDRIRFSIFGKNLLDEVYGPIAAVQSPLLITQSVSPPRQYGL